MASDQVPENTMPSAVKELDATEWEFVDGHTCPTCGSTQIITREREGWQEYGCKCGEEWAEEQEPT